jgi:hypothetical protein
VIQPSSELLAQIAGLDEQITLLTNPLPISETALGQANEALLRYIVDGLFVLPPRVNIQQ